MNSPHPAGNPARPAERILVDQIDAALEAALPVPGASPPKLTAAVRDAVLPGGNRLRPKLCLLVASACGLQTPARKDCPGEEWRLATAAAVAVELLHCASLVLDDLPCFDDAELRRGRPSVHHKHGETLAVLAGAALIVRAFEVLAATSAPSADRRAEVIATVGRAVGMSDGICAGQALELETDVSTSLYHQAKTGALFEGAVTAGAIAAGSDPERWRRFAGALGEAYQMLDDVRDVVGSAECTGKPAAQDQANGRLNVALQLGPDDALRRFRCLFEESLAAIPECPGAAELRAAVSAGIGRLVPQGIAASGI